MSGRSCFHCSQDDISCAITGFAGFRGFRSAKGFVLWGACETFRKGFAAKVTKRRFRFAVTLVTRSAHDVRAASLSTPSLPELRPARVLRLFVTVEALQFRSLVHPIPLQRLRTYICTQAAPSEPRNRPRLGKPGITISCALNLILLPRPCTFPNQLRDPSLTPGPLSTPQSLPPVGVPGGLLAPPICPDIWHFR